MTKLFKSVAFKMLSDDDCDEYKSVACSGESPTKYRERRREMRRLVTGGAPEASEGKSICAEVVGLAGEDADVAAPVFG